MNFEQMLSNTKYAVEANSFETSSIYTNFVIGGRLKDGISWKQVSLGTGVVVGHIDNRPIFVSLLWNYIHGELVLFWEATSVVVDYAVVEDWLDKNLASDLKKSDAMNFHNIEQACYKESLRTKQ